MGVATWQRLCLRLDFLAEPLCPCAKGALSGLAGWFAGVRVARLLGARLLGARLLEAFALEESSWAPPGNADFPRTCSCKNEDLCPEP